MLSGIRLVRSRGLWGVFLAALFAGIGLYACGGGGADDGGTVSDPVISLSLVPSRTTGVAPLAVFFDAIGTMSLLTSRPMHDIEYRWDFGDPAGGATWSTGSNAGVSSKNLATGPVAAHVYETTGTYTVTLTAFDGTNTDTTTVSITVDNPDVVFAAGNTRCLSNLNIFTGCPAGATQVPVVASGLAAAIAAHQGANRRILLRRGETWTVASPAVINQNGPGILGAFGSGARPIIRATGNTTILQLSSGATPSVKDWRVMDLELDGQNGTSTEGVQAEGGVDQVTLLRLNIHDVHFGVLFSSLVLDSYNSTGGTHTIWDQLAIVDSTVSRVIGGAGGYGAYVSARRFSFLGNAISDSTNAEHLLRTPYIGKGVISNSTFSNPAPQKHALKMHASTFGSAQVDGGGFTEQVVISDNKFTGGAGVDWTVALGPQDQFKDERVRDIVVERNWFTAGSGTQVALIVFASEVTVRNNICDMTGGLVLGANNCVSVMKRGIEPAPNNVRIYNNTAFCSSTVNQFTVVSLGSTASNTTVRNNLGSAPNATTRTMIVGTPPGLVQSNNLMNNSPAALFVTATPAIPANFQLKALPNPARDTGFATVPVFSDFFRSSRPQNGVIDIGAAEGP